MSDFSSLLQQLTNTANQVQTTNTNSKQKRDRSQSSNHISKKNHDTSLANTKRRRIQNKKLNNVPRDFNELSIELSFLCIGAQKAGTTWLHKMLQYHEGIALPKHQKELHFWDWHRSKGLGWYSRQFQEESEKDLLYGEITPCYAVLSMNDIHEIKLLFPKLKIIFFARDILERTWSALLMELYQNVQGMNPGEFIDNSKQDTKTLHRFKKQQIMEEANPNNFDDDYFMDRMKHSTHLTRSDYATSLRNWLQVFPKESLLIIDYRHISSQPKDVLKQVTHHIITTNHSNQKSNKESQMNQQFLNSLTDDQLSQRINVSLIKSTLAESTTSCSNSKTANYQIRPSLERKMKQFLQPIANEFNLLLKELGYSWSLDDYKE